MSADASRPEGQPSIRLSVPDDMEFKYRDMVNVYASPHEVVLQFGVEHRHAEGRVAVRDCIVLSPHSAMKLMQVLDSSLMQLHQEFVKEQKRMEKEHGVPPGATSMPDAGATP